MYVNSNGFLKSDHKYIKLKIKNKRMSQLVTYNLAVLYSKTCTHIWNNIHSVHSALKIGKLVN